MNSGIGLGVFAWTKDDGDEARSVHFGGSHTLSFELLFPYLQKKRTSFCAGL